MVYLRHTVGGMNLPTFMLILTSSGISGLSASSRVGLFLGVLQNSIAGNSSFMMSSSNSTETSLGVFSPVDRLWPVSPPADELVLPSIDRHSVENSESSLVEHLSRLMSPSPCLPDGMEPASFCSSWSQRSPFPELSPVPWEKPVRARPRRGLAELSFVSIDVPAPPLLWCGECNWSFTEMCGSDLYALGSRTGIRDPSFSSLRQAICDCALSEPFGDMSGRAGEESVVVFLWVGSTASPSLELHL